MKLSNLNCGSRWIHESSVYFAGKKRPSKEKLNQQSRRSGQTCSVLVCRLSEKHELPATHIQNSEGKLPFTESCQFSLFLISLRSQFCVGICDIQGLVFLLFVAHGWKVFRLYQDVFGKQLYNTVTTYCVSLVCRCMHLPSGL